MLHLSPTNLSPPSRKKTHLQLKTRAIHKSVSLDERLKTFLESIRRRLGQKQKKGEDRRSNRTMKNHKSVSLDKRLKTFLESIRRRLGQKQKKGEDRRSNRTMKNNKTADRKIGSNDSPEIPGRGGEDIRNVRSPFGPNERRCLRDTFVSIKYQDERTGR